MKIYIYPADQTGCGYYRLIWPARVLLAQGHDIVIVPPHAQREQFRAAMMEDKMIDIHIPADADVVVLQRVTHRYLVQAVELIQAKGVAVVIDMDDDLTCIDPANPAWAMLHPRTNGDHSWQHASDACAKATWVTVSTPALMGVYAAHGRGQVIHNYVPRFFTQIPHVDRITPGWGGSVHSHPRDLQELGAATGKALAAGHGFTIVGGEQGLADALGSSVAERCTVTGVIDFHAWPSALADHLGIGLAPLADTRFNAAKSWLKPLEYAAVGLPTISSDRAEYRRLHREFGIGRIADSRKAWARHIHDLATNEWRRVEEGERNRQIVDEQLTVEDHAWRWAEAWATAASRRRKTALGQSISS